MKQVYFKKMTKQDITKSVSVCTDSLQSFWEVDTSETTAYQTIEIAAKSDPTNFPEGITLHKGNVGDKDWRLCGSEFKKLYSQYNPEEGDLMCVEKNKKKFFISIIKKSTEEYDCISKFLVSNDNYLIIKLTDKLHSENPNLILYGPPGTGKTFDLQNESLRYKPTNRTIITFHQSYSYQEFIIGIRAKTNDKNEIEYYTAHGIFYKACEEAAKLAGFKDIVDCCNASPEQRNFAFAQANSDPDKQYLFCIDEINRANISSVFGDLISLIEKDKRLGGKREMMVQLPCDQSLFGVPANLKIIGTMNTADKSIQLIDSALRRRFDFKEYLPKVDLLKNKKAKSILKAMNSRIRAILNKDLQIGHSYFFDIDNGPESDTLVLRSVVTQIIPLLQEYFYNDTDKIRFVLGEPSSRELPASKCFFIEDTEAKDAFMSYNSDYGDKSFYQFNTEKIEEALSDQTKANEILKHIYE